MKSFICVVVCCCVVIAIATAVSHANSNENGPLRGSKAAKEMKSPRSRTPNSFAINSGQTPRYQTPPTFDWTAATSPWSGNYVTSVKHQYGETCWAFSTAAAVESAMIIGGGWPAPDISMQQLLDCVYPGRSAKYYYEAGHFGWDPRIAMQYLRAKGAQTLQSYPYTGVDGADTGTGTCNYDPAQVVQHISGVCIQSTPMSASTLQSVIFNNGPQAVQVAANLPSWSETNSKGLITCSYADSQTSAGNHAVLLVGYNTDANGNNYWKVKNSWGTSWGFGGYGHIDATPNQDCGILNTLILASPILSNTPLNPVGCTNYGGQPPTYLCDPWNYCVDDNNSNGYLCGSTEGQQCIF